MASNDVSPISSEDTTNCIVFLTLDADGNVDINIAETIKIATSSSVYYLDLTSAEMNADTVIV